MSQPEDRDVAPSEASTAAAASDQPSVTAATPAPVVPRSRKPRQSVTTIPDLLRIVYGQRRRLPTLSAKSLVAMQAAGPMATEDRDLLLHLASSDRTLERTRMLLSFSTEQLRNTGLAGPVRQFAQEVLAAHPLFQAGRLRAAIHGLPDGSDEEDAVRHLAAHDMNTLEWSSQSSPLKKNESVQCRANAIACLLLWFYETRSLPLDRLVSLLHKSVWQPAVPRRNRNEPKHVAALVAARDATALAVACDVLGQQVQEQKHAATNARAAQERESMRALKAETSLREADAELKGAQANAHSLAEQLRAEQDAREADAAHFRDDYQRLRGSILQRVKADVTLLDEGLQALRSPTPKVYVMVDHTERVIEALKREMDRLRGDLT